MPGISRGLGGSFEKLNEMPVEDVEKIVRELRIHQIELEMQNEELLQSQAALEESRARFRELYDHAPVGIVKLLALMIDPGRKCYAG